jgi:hypothetical protein
MAWLPQGMVIFLIYVGLQQGGWENSKHRAKFCGHVLSFFPPFSNG